MYRIFAFDGIEIPEYNPNHNMGTGRANTSYQQLPGGTYYDNFGSSKASRGVRPIFVRGTSYAATEAALKASLDDLRKKIGVRGKLTMMFDDGELRWQWARIAEVDTPSEYQLGNNRFDFVLTAITAAQQWYGVIVSDEEWTWGDLSWTFGDGTAEMGESGTETALTATGATGTAPPAGGTTQDITLTNNGNIAATNLVLTITAGATDIDAIKITNGANSDTFYFSATVSAGEVLSIDVGAKNVTNNGSNAYSNFTPGNKAKWMDLEPGDNTLTVICNGNTAADSTFGAEYYEHYA